MKLAELRALPLGTPLLLDGAAPRETVLYAGLSDGDGRRTRARVLGALGNERQVLTRQLAPAVRRPHPDVFMLVPGMTGHTVTVERITAATWSRLGIRRGTVGDLAAIERKNGALESVCCLHADLWGGSIETAARSYADSYGARYIPIHPAARQNGDDR